MSICSTAPETKMTLATVGLREEGRAIVEEFFREKVPKALKSRDDTGAFSTESSCIAFAKALLATEDLIAAENQGANSFTLTCPSRGVIVQFRLVPLDISIINHANRIYGDLVPQVEFVPDFTLPVYTSKIIPGKIHVLQLFPKNDFPLQREKATVADLGRFVAQAAWHESPKQYGASSSTGSAFDAFERLLGNSSLKALAPELVEVIAGIQPKLNLLDKLPAVLTHNDFSQVNILVADDGKVTGVIDFESARVEAFGTCIWGLYECFFGSMEAGKWNSYDMPAQDSSGKSVREVLESTFWTSLWTHTPPSLERHEIEEAVKVALSVGVIARYFIRGMLDDIDLSLQVHQRSLEYAKGILPQIWR